MANFGHKLNACNAVLSNFKLSNIEIKDSDVIASGKNIHPKSPIQEILII